MPSVPCVTARAKPSPSPNKRAAISPIVEKIFLELQPVEALAVIV